MKKIILLFVLAFSLAFTACESALDDDYNFEYNSANSANIEKAIELVNGWGHSEPDITSFIDSEFLTIQFPDGRQIKKLLPQDKFYIAVAPYENTTHTCKTHYPSSCDGEMKNTEFDYEIYKGSEKIQGGKITSLRNGFFELWLPRNVELKLLVKKGGKQAEQVVRTFPESNTCVTTMQLQ